MTASAGSSPLLPFANETADTYRAGNPPPAEAAITGLSTHLEEHWSNIKQLGAAFTHTALFIPGQDVRDSDLHYVPGGGAADAAVSTVQFVARRGKGTDQDFLVAYLSRGTANWPTADL